MISYLLTRQTLEAINIAECYRKKVKNSRCFPVWLAKCERSDRLVDAADTGIFNCPGSKPNLRHPFPAPPVSTVARSSVSPSSP